MTLIPINLIVPNESVVYAPSRLKRKLNISDEQFMRQYADRPHPKLVSFETDHKSNPVSMTAYADPMGNWYIVE